MMNVKHPVSPTVNFVTLLVLISIVSCTNEKKEEEYKNISPENIYYDYRVTAEEGRDDATVFLQYRFGDEEGTTLLLEEPSKVTFDGTKLKADSAKLTGDFYEVIKPLKDFTGKHTIVFTDVNNKEHKEEFSFEPSTLAAEFPEKVKKEPFVIKLNNFPSEPTNVRLVMIDTSFATKDVNDEMLVNRGEIQITNRRLNSLSAGPITFEIYMEEEKPLKNASKKGGRILITYGLKRQFELVE